MMWRFLMAFWLATSFCISIQSFADDKEIPLEAAPNSSDDKELPLDVLDNPKKKKKSKPKKEEPQPYIPKRSSVRFTTSKDDAETKTFAMSLAAQMNEEAVILLGFDRTAPPVTDDADLSSTNFNIGASVDIEDEGNLRIEYENWGQSDTFITKGPFANLSWFPGDWTLGVNLGYKRMEITLNTANQRVIDSGFAQIGASVSYYGFEPFWLKFEHNGYSFRDDVTRLNTEAALIVLPITAISLSSSLLDKQSSLTLGLGWPRFWIDAEAINSTSAIDKTITKTGIVRIGAQIFSWFSLEFESGVSRPESGEDLKFFGTTVGVHW